MPSTALMPDAHAPVSQSVVILLTNQLLMKPLSLIRLPFYFCRPHWRIPCLLPCPEPRALPPHALDPAPPATDLTQYDWDSPTLRHLAAEAKSVMLQVHLSSLAAASESSLQPDADALARAIQVLRDCWCRVSGDLRRFSPVQHIKEVYFVMPCAHSAFHCTVQSMEYSRAHRTAERSTA